jgi:hypothetical protein
MILSFESLTLPFSEVFGLKTQKVMNYELSKI